MSPISRRTLLFGAVGMPLVPAISTYAQRPSSATSEDEAPSLLAQVSGVVRAKQILYSNLKQEKLFTEPLLLAFTNYEFESAQEAVGGFPVIVEHIEGYLLELIDDQYQKEVSIGRVGEDRAAFYAEDDKPTLHAAVLQGNQALTCLAISLGGDVTTFVGEFLEEFVPTAVEEERSLLPELADMPLGWEASRPADDVTEDVNPGKPGLKPTPQLGHQLWAEPG